MHRLPIATARRKKGNSAGFPQFNAQVPLPPSAKADPPLLPASAIGSEKGFQEQKGKGKNYDYEKGGKPELAKGGKPESAKGGKPEFEKGGKPEFAKGGKDEKGGKDDKGGKNVAKGEFKGEFKGKEGDKGKQRSQKGPHCLLPKLLVRSVPHASPKSLRRLLRPIRTKCMTMVL